MELNEEYWSARYAENRTGWDLGVPSPPLKDIIDAQSDKDIRILIPGAGNAHEAEYLWKQGFKNISILDISELPLKQFKSRCPKFPDENLLHEDFFQLNDQFDLILEQTFFCALDPVLRNDYVVQMSKLLAPMGSLQGVLFDFPLPESGPPFGDVRENYFKLFSTRFNVEKLEKCMNSIGDRAGKEIIFKLTTKLI